MQTIYIPRHIYNAMIAHARDEFPNSVIGLIIGPKGEMREVHGARNAALDPFYTYDADARDLLRLHQRVNDNDWELIAIYYSHPPFAETYPSAIDVARASYPDAVYIILAIGQVSRQFRDDLRDPTKRAAIVATWGDPQTLTPRMRAYRIVKEDWSSKEGQIEELRIEITNELIQSQEEAKKLRIEFTTKKIQSREMEIYQRMQTLDELRTLNPLAFEQFVGSLFKKMGYIVETTKLSGDEGVDLILRKGAKLAVVQCKRYDGAVGQPIVRDLYGVMFHNRADEAYLITTGTITLPAQQWAKGKPIHLVDGNMLLEWKNSLEDT
jgi:restriction system protein